MRLKKIIFIGLCLVLSAGLIHLNVGVCQQPKPDETGTKLPAATPAGKTPAPQPPCNTPAKAPGEVKPESKPAAPAIPPAKEPAKPEENEGC
ncbi:MAG: hypothetical protein WBW52_14105 [Desulfobaccales bacterium]